MRTQEQTDKIKADVQALIDAPMCYSGLRELAENWLSSIGTDAENEAAAKLIAELEADVTPIDKLLAFASSPKAKEKFGEEAAKAFEEHAKQIKAEGAEFCDCPACAAGCAILKNKEFLCQNV